MTVIKKPEVAGIAQFLEENRGGLTDIEFTERYLKGVSDSLKNNKKLYRSFGGFWWPLKRLILAYDHSMIDHIGEEFDAELNDMFSYSNDAITVCAAYLTQQVNMETGYMESNKHTYETAGNEPVDLTVDDSEIEGRMFAESFV
jgi:hypothetical protein